MGPISQTFARPRRGVLLAALLAAGLSRPAAAQNARGVVGVAGGLPQLDPAPITFKPANLFVGDEVEISVPVPFCGNTCKLHIAFGDGSVRVDSRMDSPSSRPGDHKTATFRTRYLTPGDKVVRVDVDDPNVYMVGRIHVTPSMGGHAAGPPTRGPAGGGVAVGPPPSGGKGSVGVAGGLPQLDPASVTFKPANPFVGDEIEISFRAPVCGNPVSPSRCSLHVAFGDGSVRSDFQTNWPVPPPGKPNTVTFQTRYRTPGDKAIRIDVDNPNVYLVGRVHVTPSPGGKIAGPPTSGPGVVAGPPPSGGNVGTAGGIPKVSPLPLTLQPSVVAVGIQVSVSFPTPDCGTALRPAACTVHVTYGDGSTVPDFQAFPTDPARQKTMSFRTSYRTPGRKAVRIDIDETNEYLTGFVTVSAAAGGPGVSPQPKAATLPN